MEQKLIEALSRGNGKVHIKIAVLRKYMEAKGWDDAELARRMNCSRSTVSRLLNGNRNPGLQTIAKLLKACEQGLEFEELFFLGERFTERHPQSRTSNTKAS